MGGMIIIIIALFVAYKWGLMNKETFNPKPPDEQDMEELRKESEAEREAFREKYGAELDALFKEYPDVEYWAGRSCERIAISLKNGKYLFGHIVLDENGHILGWESERWESDGGNTRFKKINVSLEDQVKIDKIKAMLKDNDNIRKYCDLVAEQLLDNDHQAFNAIEGLGCTQKRFDAEYYDESWINAWETALLHEFSAKHVEYKGDGVFMLEAI